MTISRLYPLALYKLAANIISAASFFYFRELHSGKLNKSKKLQKNVSTLDSTNFIISAATNCYPKWFDTSSANTLAQFNQNVVFEYLKVRVKVANDCEGLKDDHRIAIE